MYPPTTGLALVWLFVVSILFPVFIAHAAQ